MQRIVGQSMHAMVHFYGHHRSVVISDLLSHPPAQAFSKLAHCFHCWADHEELELDHRSFFHCWADHCLGADHCLAADSTPGASTSLAPMGASVSVMLVVVGAASAVPDPEAPLFPVSSQADS